MRRNMTSSSRSSTSRSVEEALEIFGIRYGFALEMSYKLKLFDSEALDTSSDHTSTVLLAAQIKQILEKRSLQL